METKVNWVKKDSKLVGVLQIQLNDDKISSIKKLVSIDEFLYGTNKKSAYIFNADLIYTIQENNIEATLTYKPKENNEKIIIPCLNIISSLLTDNEKFIIIRSFNFDGYGEINENTVNSINVNNLKINAKMYIDYKMKIKEDDKIVSSCKMYYKN